MRRVFAALVESKECHAVQRIALGVTLASGTDFPDSAVIGLLEGESATCRALMMAELQNLQSPRAEVVRYVLERAKACGDIDACGAAWLTAGTFARRARDAGNASLAANVTHAIAKHASDRAYPWRTQALDAAGNAGSPDLSGILESEVREAGDENVVSAAERLRFAPTESATAALCDLLLHRSDVHARSRAAWALGWSSAGISRRLECLGAGASADEQLEVRIEATRSLVRLASLRGEHEESTYAILEVLGSRSLDLQVRAIAKRAVAERGLTLVAE